ncbi:MAG: peroxiredoxin [Pseudomonadota bacterium]
MTVSVGSQLPQVSLFHVGEDGPASIATGDFFANKRVVLFAVPGAFTPTCHMNHLPGFVENADAIKAKGIDEIAVVSVNDVFVMDAWENAAGAEGKIKFLSDPNADLAKALGLELDLTERGLGVRSQRYSMIIDNGKITALNIEPNPGEAVASGADVILNAL